VNGDSEFEFNLILSVDHLKRMLRLVFRLMYNNPPQQGVTDVFIQRAVDHTINHTTVDKGLTYMQFASVFQSWAAALEAFKPLRQTYLHVVLLEPTKGEWKALEDNVPTIYNLLLRKGGCNHCIVGKRFTELIEMYEQLKEAEYQEMNPASGGMRRRALRGTLSTTSTLRLKHHTLQFKDDMLPDMPNLEDFGGINARSRTALRMLPDFPVKHGFSLTAWENYSDSFIMERRQSLQHFFDVLLDGEEWHEHPVLLDFFGVHSSIGESSRSETKVYSKANSIIVNNGGNTSSVIDQRNRKQWNTEDTKNKTKDEEAYIDGEENSSSNVLDEATDEARYADALSWEFEVGNKTPAVASSPKRLSLSASRGGDPERVHV